MPESEELYQALSAFFGHKAFREPQEAIIRGILDRRDVIGILPTGTGKSLCYQLPAVFFQGITLVLSPLVALMKDQVDALTAKGIPCTALNSHLTPKQMRERIQEIRELHYKVIYLAPEKLFSEDFREVLLELPLDHIAVDEAHCISQWGHDFRPKYKKIAQALGSLPGRPVISAFTATASPEVLAEIQNLLRLEDPLVFRTTFDRPNLYLDVVLYPDKMKVLLAFLKEELERPALGLVYCNTRDEAGRIQERLLKEGYRAGLYHGGMPRKERAEVQEAFFREEYQVLIATNAFGMGLDKENIRFVLHYNLPSSLEGYYQEIGRGGRDGLPCRCLLLLGLKDVAVNRVLGKQRVYSRWRLEQKEGWLREMVAYAHSRGCYRRAILRHFGEEGEDCGYCGNCQARRVEKDRTMEARKILSGIWHTKGYGGRGALAACLRGRKLKLLRERGWDQLSVFGILKESREEEILILLEELVLRGFLESQEERLILTPAGARLLKGEETFTLLERS